MYCKISLWVGSTHKTITIRNVGEEFVKKLVACLICIPNISSITISKN